MQRHSTSLLWWIVAALTVITIAVSAYVFLTHDSNSAPFAANLTVTEPDIAPKLDTQASSEPVIIETHFQPTPNKVLVEEQLLTEALPSNSTLAQEEIAKQHDLQQQLIAQEKLLQQQNLTADELIRLKQQQIKLLEQQLAALEKPN